MALARLITFRDVARMLGEQGPAGVRRVRRLLLSHQSADHFLVRVGSSALAERRDGTARANGRRYLVSLAALRQYLPQLRDAEGDLVPLVRAEIERTTAELDEQITELRDEIETLGREMGRRIRGLEERAGR